MLDALLLDVTGLAIDVRNGGQQAPEIDRSGAELRVARAGRARGEARHDQVLRAEPVGDSETPLPPDEHDGGRDVRRGRAQPFVIEGGPDLLGGPAEIPE